MPHLAEKFKDQALVAKVNSDTETPLTQKFWVRSLPTVIIFKNGQEVERLRWLLPPESYVEIVEKWLADTTQLTD
jgi:thioredoxin 1